MALLDAEGGESLSRNRRRALFGDETPVPLETALRNSLKRWVIDINDTETLPVAFCPLKIIEQRPNKIAGKRHAIVYRTAGSSEI